jgi:hypothetical protein
MLESCTVTLNMDWELLRDQKLLLLEATYEHPDLMGVVHLIDTIQDQAHEQGCDVKWLTEEDEVDNA